MELSKEEVINKINSIRFNNNTVDKSSITPEEMLDIFKWYLKNGPVVIDADGNSTDSVIPLITSAKDISLLEYSMIRIKQYLEI